MATNYNALQDLILQWSNRDVEIFNGSPANGTTPIDYGLLPDFLRYAADKAYRVLRIPSLEKTVRYNFESDLSRNAEGQTVAEWIATTMDSDGETIDPPNSMDNFVGVEQQTNIVNNCIPVPADLIEFIHIRIVDAFGTGNSIVLNNKADTRTFHDYYAEKYDPNYTWTRQGGNILLPANPGVQTGCEYEIFYYGRLGALGASYNATHSNWEAGVGSVTAPASFDNWMAGRGTIELDQTADGDDNPIQTLFADASVANQAQAVFEAAQSTWVSNEIITPDVIDELAFNTRIGDGTLVWAGNEAFNWLVIENERILLFGALAEAFAYLGEDDMQQKYTALFLQEIAQLNDEEKMRHASGGNVQVNFDGRGLI